MEAVDGELRGGESTRFSIRCATLVAQSMCFSEARKTRGGGPELKGGHDARSSEFAPYRQAALSVEAVKRRVEMVQKSA